MSNGHALHALPMDPDHDWKEQLRSLHRESYAWCLFCCNHDTEMAKDALQIVYMKVFEGRAKFSGRSSLKSWLFTVIRNTVVDLMRKKGSADVTLNEIHHRIPAEVNVENDQRLLFLDILSRLSNQQRAVLTLAFYHNLSLTEVAQALGLSIGSVRSHYERGKQNFRKLLIQDKDFELP